MNAQTAADAERRLGEKVFTIPMINESTPEGAQLASTYRLLGVEPGQKLNNAQMQTVLSGFVSLTLDSMAAGQQNDLIADVWSKVFIEGMKGYGDLALEAFKEARSPQEFKMMLGKIEEADPRAKGFVTLFNYLMQVGPGGHLFTGVSQEELKMGLSALTRKGVGFRELGASVLTTEGQQGQTGGIGVTDEEAEEYLK
jgi:hypothetical protein